MRFFALGVLLFSLWVSPLAAAEVPGYALNTAKSSLKFQVVAKGAPIEGKFERFTADIRFDPEQLDKSSIRAEVDVTSVSVGDSEVMKAIVLPTWLSTEKFPKAKLVTKKINKMPGGDNYYADAELTLRGVTMPVSLNFQVDRVSDARVIASGFMTLHRSEFGVGEGEYKKDDVVKEEVNVQFRMVAQKQ